MEVNQTDGQLAGPDYEQAARLNAFFARLYSEVVLLQVDSLGLRTESNGSRITLYRETQEVKSVSLPAEWYMPAVRWFLNRAIVTMPPYEFPQGDGLPNSPFCCGFELGDQIIIGECTSKPAKKGKDSLVVENVRVVNRSTVYAECGCDGSTSQAFDQIAHAEYGLIVVCAPDENQLKLAVSMTAALCGGVYVGKIENPSIRSSIGEWNSSGLVIGGVVSSDPVDALLKLRGWGMTAQGSKICGLICQGFVRKTCTSCARETVVDRRLIDTLPRMLQPAPGAPYMVGRGCPACSNTGYLGQSSIECALSFESDLRISIDQASGQGEIISILSKRGLVPLMVDGLGKVKRHKTTFESLFQVVSSVPEAYLKHVQPRSVSERDEDLSIAESENFVTGEGEVPLQAKSGRAAFYGREDLVEDEPLFGPSRKSRSKPAVLVVEDDCDQRSILLMVLRSAQYEVWEAPDGEAALQVLKKEIPDLIVTDLNMPRLDGAELVRRIRADKVLRNVPILVLTVISDSEKEYALLDLGADDYCEKTIQRKLLLKRVENLLKRKG